MPSVSLRSSVTLATQSGKNDTITSFAAVEHKSLRQHRYGGVGKNGFYRPGSINELRPLCFPYVVERVTTEDKTAGGIFLPESAKDKQSRGTVIAVGDGRLMKDGSRSPLQVAKGDHVLFTTYGPEEFKDGDNEFLLMREDDVLAILG